ncbi:MAG: hypothetical protein QOF01_1320, partial [Thermomicrobiales bacterium]|nr:hypothetical protein [Thermomicrobiales bacterium]
MLFTVPEQEPPRISDGESVLILDIAYVRDPRTGQPYPWARPLIDSFRSDTYVEENA